MVLKRWQRAVAEAEGQQWQRRTSLARRVMLQRLGMRASFSKPQRDGLCDQGADERLLKSQLSMLVCPLASPGRPPRFQFQFILLATSVREVIEKKKRDD